MAELHFGDAQIVIGVVFAVLAALLAVAFVVIGMQAGTDVGYERVQRVGYWLQRRWMALLAAIGVVAVGLALLEAPYASGDGGDRTVVTVTSGQFFWSLQPASVPAGTAVRFDVTSVDVNHGFGLYDPHGHLIGSVQAMPGYHNELDLTLDTPGSYRIRCFEYCALNHAQMESTFTVDAS